MTRLVFIMLVGIIAFVFALISFFAFVVGGNEGAMFFIAGSFALSWWGKRALRRDA